MFRIPLKCARFIKNSTELYVIQTCMLTLFGTVILVNTSHIWAFNIWWWGKKIKITCNSRNYYAIKWAVKYLHKLPNPSLYIIYNFNIFPLKVFLMIKKMWFFCFFFSDKYFYNCDILTNIFGLCLWSLTLGISW